VKLKDDNGAPINSNDAILHHPDNSAG